MLKNGGDAVRVLHMIGSLEIGGSQMMVLNLYRSLDRDKIQFDFIIDRKDAVGLLPEVEALGARVYTMPQFKGYNIRETIKAWNRFFEEHLEYKILHSHVRSYASLYIPIAKKYGLKTIIHSHSTSNGKGLTSAVKKLLQYPLRYQADYLFACSIPAGVWLFGKRAAKGERFKIVKNGIDCDRFTFDSQKRKEMRNRLGIQDNFVVGYVGRFTASKNHLFLIEIFAAIYQRHPAARLLLVGEGECESQIRGRCCALGVEQAVIFAGAQRNAEEFYTAMDVFCFPSLWEGLGIVAVEAQTNGLHCVASDVVPPEADIQAGLYHPVSLGAGPERWAAELLRFKNEPRLQNAPDYTRRAGYDILETAQTLQNFYLEQGRE